MSFLHTEVALVFTIATRTCNMIFTATTITLPWLRDLHTSAGGSSSSTPAAVRRSGHALQPRCVMVGELRCPSFRSLHGCCHGHGLLEGQVVLAQEPLLDLPISDYGHQSVSEVIRELISKFAVL